MPAARIRAHFIIAVFQRHDQDPAADKDPFASDLPAAGQGNVFGITHAVLPTPPSPSSELETHGRKYCRAAGREEAAVFVSHRPRCRSPTDIILWRCLGAGDEIVLVCPSASQSATSPFSFSSVNGTIRISGTIPRSAAATWAACLRPGSSLSSQCNELLAFEPFIERGFPFAGTLRARGRE